MLVLSWELQTLPLQFAWSGQVRLKNLKETRENCIQEGFISQGIHRYCTKSTHNKSV